MSDRTIISLAAVPMLSGALLLLALQRAPASHARAPAPGARSNVLAPSPEPAPREMRWVGVVVAGNTAELAAEQDGRVTDVWLEAGARVRTGQPILQIDSTEAVGAVGVASAELGQRSSEAARAEAHLEEATNKLRRLKAGGNWISDHELEMAQAEVRMATAELRAAQSGVQMGRAKVSIQRNRADRQRLTAPFAGTLVACDVDPGDSVAAGQILARVISDDRQVRFAFPPDQAPHEGELQVMVRDPITGRALMTKVKTVKPEVDTSAQLVFATATLALTETERSTWIPGTRVEVTPADAASDLHDERVVPTVDARGSAREQNGESLPSKQKGK